MGLAVIVAGICIATYAIVGAPHIIIVMQPQLYYVRIVASLHWRTMNWYIQVLHT